MIKFAAVAAIVGISFFANTDSHLQAQMTVTTYYAPAPTVGYVPVRRGLLGLRTGYIPVAGSVSVPVTTYYAPPPVVTTYYAPLPLTTTPVTTFYAPVSPVTPVTTYYAPPPQPVTTYYSPGIIISR